MGLVDDYHVWILPEMDLSDVRRAAKYYNTCDVNAVLKNVLMVGKTYVDSNENKDLKVDS